MAQEPEADEYASPLAEQRRLSLGACSCRSPIIRAVPRLSDLRRLPAPKGTKLVHVPSSIEELVGSSSVPLAVLELPSGNVLLANAAAARVLGVTSETLIGSNYLDLVVTEEQQAAEEAFQALAHGALTGYQAVGSFRMEKGPAQQMALWVFAVEVEGERVVLVSAVPVHGGTTALEPTTTVLNGPPPGHIVLGTIDNEWRIDRVSHDVVEMLGYDPDEVVGMPLLGAINPRRSTVFLGCCRARPHRPTHGTGQGAHQGEVERLGAGHDRPGYPNQ